MTWYIGTQSSIAHYYDIDGQKIERDNGMAIPASKTHID